MRLAVVVLVCAVVLSGCSAVSSAKDLATPTPAPVRAISTSAAKTTGLASGVLSTPTAKSVGSGTKIADIKVVGELFLSSVEVRDSFNKDSSWIIGEYGVILDDSATWTRGQLDAPYHVNLPEGGFTFFSLGEGKITIDGVTIVLEPKRGRNYLFLARGRIDDTIVDSDLNLTAVVEDYAPGHAIWSEMPTGARVSKGWFLQQLVASTTAGFSNCGATGCSETRIVLFDADSHFCQMFQVQAGHLEEWKLLEANA
jgi:hypothetical protein